MKQPLDVELTVHIEISDIWILAQFEVLLISLLKS